MNDVGGNALKLGAELLVPVPGASQVVAGDLKSGLIHAAVGVAIAAAVVPFFPVLGTVAILGTKLNSLASSMSGGHNNLWSIGRDAVRGRTEPTTEPPTQAGPLDPMIRSR